MSSKRKLEENNIQDSNSKKAKCDEKHDLTSVGILKNKNKNIEVKEVEQCESKNNMAKTEEETTQSGKKSRRKRKKHFYNSIRQLMEFYFSDANLRRDNFFGRLIKEDPYIPLEVFMKCNKIKELTQQPEDIVKALTNSTILELNEEKNCVKRRIPFESSDKNVDKNILYVESLPVYADQDWVKDVFQRFGKVTYVSLPRYLKSRKIKGFAFVEFENEGCVKRAIETFSKYNSVLFEMEDKPMELASCKNYYESEQVEEEEKAEKEPNKVSEVHVEKLEEKENSVVNENKRKRTLDEEDVENNPKIKKIESSKDNEKQINIKNDDQSNQKSIETFKSTTDVSSDNEEIEDGSEQVKNKKKNRKKHKISKNIQLERSKNQLAADVIYYELKVLPKQNWKRLRNMYLNLQRAQSSKLKLKHKEKMAGSKRAEAKEQLPQHESEQFNEAGNSDNINEETSKLQQQMNMNFYGAAQDGCVQVESSTSTNNCSAYKMEPGLIVEVSFLEPCIEVKDFKAEMRQNNSVKYVDLKEGDMKARIRLESADAALDFVQKTQCAEYRCSILSGKAEIEYWNKIRADRHEKLNKTIKVQKRRGREKVQAIVRKIKFNDTDNENEATINDQVYGNNDMI